jgi:hypothetical protein
MDAGVLHAFVENRIDLWPFTLTNSRCIWNGRRRRTWGVRRGLHQSFFEHTYK